LRDSTVGNVRDGIETHKWGGREVASYEIRSNSRKVRVAVFGSKGSWYECEAGSLKPLEAPTSYESLWAVQQAVLKSLR
jgi:hypothetical protein